MSDVQLKQKRITKDELKNVIKNERNVFLNSIVDLYSQKKCLSEQLHEANNILKICAFPKAEEYKEYTEKQLTKLAQEYINKWGV